MGDYWIMDDVRGIVGPIGRQTVCDLFETGMVSQDSCVSRDGQSYVSVAQFDEFGDFIQAPSTRVPDFAGRIEDRSMIRVIHDIYNQNLTGLLVAEDGHVRKDLYLENGETTFLSTNHSAERFGKFLLQHERINEVQLQTALQWVKDKKTRLGDALVGLGLFEPSALFEEIRAHQLSRLFDLCCWQFGKYEFFADRIFHGDEPEIRFAIPAIVTKAIRQMTATMLLYRLKSELGLVPRFTGQFEPDKWIFNKLEKSVIGLIDGRRTGLEIIVTFADGPLPSRTPLVVLFWLREVEAIEFGD